MVHKKECERNNNNKKKSIFIFYNYTENHILIFYVAKHIITFIINRHFHKILNATSIFPLSSEEVEEEFNNFNCPIHITFKIIHNESLVKY